MSLGSTTQPVIASTWGMVKSLEASLCKELSTRVCQPLREELSMVFSATRVLQDLRSQYLPEALILILEKEFGLAPGRDQVSGEVPSLWGARNPCARTE